RTAAGSAVVATWAAALVQMLLIERFGREIVKQPRQYDFKRWFRVALPLMVITVCDLALQNTDVLIVSAYLTPTEVGMYFAAAKTRSRIMFIHYGGGGAVASQFSALEARGDHENL